MATKLRRTPDNELPTIEAAQYRIREYQALLKDSRLSDDHKMYLARIRALRARWGIEQPANLAYNAGLLASKLDVDEYSARVTEFRSTEV